MIDPDGYLWRGVEDVYRNAKPEEALIEGRAQIKKALTAGIDVTHLDSHMGTLQLNADSMKRLIKEEEKIILMGYRPIRELQRSERKAGGVK